MAGQPTGIPWQTTLSRSFDMCWDSGKSCGESWRVLEADPRKRRSRVCGRTSVTSLYAYCRTREFCEFLTTPPFLSACCRRPASALPLYEVASLVLLVTMHNQPGWDLAYGLRSLPAREGLRRLCQLPKERGGVPALSSVTFSSLSLSNPDLSRFQSAAEARLLTEPQFGGPVHLSFTHYSSPLGGLGSSFTFA